MRDPNENMDYEIVYSDVWGKRRDRSAKLPEKAIPILALQVVEAGFGFDIILFLNRTEESDELWVLNQGEDGLLDEYADLKSGMKSLHCFSTSEFGEPYCCLAIIPQSQVRDACYHLLDQYYRGRVPFNYPGQFIAPGLVDKDTHDHIVASIEVEIAANHEEAQKKDSEIIKTAMRLGLNPESPTLSPGIWSARCPGTQHHLHISPKTNTFGCGYCRRKGGVEELRIFCLERRAM